MGVRGTMGDRWKVAGLALVVGLGLGSASHAAENILVEVGPASRTFSVDELAAYARTGESSRQLQYYFDQLDAETLEGITEALNYPIEVDFVQFAKFLRSPGGECVLEEIAQFVTPDIDSLSGSKALRAALVNAASPDGKMSAIEILEKYPASTIQVDQNALQGEGDRYAELQEDINTLLQDAGIEEGKSLADVDYDVLAEGASRLLCAP
ncbi:MAG: alpha/beta hydrolase [Cyanobacteria bacterium J06639_1]